jgi:hypothetical protein
MFDRADWTLFRTVEGLTQKAGVPASELRRVVLKEIGDNGLDEAGSVNFGCTASGGYYIEDAGPGRDGTPGEIAELFSIRRSLRSTKLLRLPQRGQLGNGLRVVAGAVLASSGSLTVITRNKHIALRPEANGSTTVLKVTLAKQPIGTRIAIAFGPALPEDPDALDWVRAAQEVASGGEAYNGRSSPFWYDAAQFHELLLACGTQPVRRLVAQLDGCTGGKAGEIVAAAGLDRKHCQDIDRTQAAKLLTIARLHARPVSPDRLGTVGREAFPKSHYAKESGSAVLGSDKPRAEVPFVVEVWARKVGISNKVTDEIDVSVLVNRTPITAEVSAWRNGDGLSLFGAGLSDDCANIPNKGAYRVRINLITPYCPITSDGKEPDLGPFADGILDAVAGAVRKAQRAAPKEKKASQKDVVLDNLDDAIAAASGDGQYRFNERQIFYQLRKTVLEETGRELTITNFKRIITDYENEHGEIDGMYREPRGSLYHPHGDNEDIALGTLTVEEYERPEWAYNKLLYVEKEGFSEALKADGWPERHDCALMSSKGFTTRAARDLVDKLAEHNEPVTIFCVHDADAYGTMIFQTFQEETAARAARKVQIINLGLEPWEAIGSDMEVEDVPRGDQRKPVAQYVFDRDDGEEWVGWLQTHRVELNAMTTPEFIVWLDAKMAEHGTGKLIPPDAVIAAALEAQLAAKVRTAVTERVLREAGVDDRVAAALGAIKRPKATDLTDAIKLLFEGDRQCQWRDRIDAIADQLSRALRRVKP